MNYFILLTDYPVEKICLVETDYIPPKYYDEFHGTPIAGDALGQPYNFSKEEKIYSQHNCIAKFDDRDSAMETFSIIYAALLEHRKKVQDSRGIFKTIVSLAVPPA